MKKIKNILKSKRGIALENAILFLITTFTLCALLTTFTLIGRYQSNIENTVLKRKVAVEQIGEDFVEYVKSHPNNGENDNGENVFTITEDSENTYGCVATDTTLKVFHKSNTSKILLYVEVIGGEVTRWVYNPAEIPEQSNSNTTSTAATTTATTTTTGTTQTTTAAATTAATTTSTS